MKATKIILGLAVVDLLAMLALVVFTGYTISRPVKVPDESAYNAELVYEVCQESRISPTIDERGCADLQDQLGYEYLCRQNNASADNVCWVERH